MPNVVPIEPQLRAALGELARRLSSGTLDAAEDLRDTFPDVWADADATLELVYAEYVYRARHGEAPPRADWYRRFPALRERLERLFAIYDLAGDPTPLDRSFPEPDGYEILDEIGRGGMGVVYKARQLDLNRVVALKMLRGPLGRDEDGDRIRREAEAVARVRHPNVVQIHAIGDLDGVPFLCLEYIPGGSLEDALAEAQRPGRPGISPPDAARIVEVLARAMHAAHELGVVHRDLKPSNILLGSQSDPLHTTLKITDFGLATLAETPGDVTRTGTIVGTPCYMAPEQAASDRAAIGPRTDVYALGGILYQLLTGRPPFEGSTALETVQLVRDADPVAPRRLRPGVPRDLETICLMCLRKEPARRYATAAALADDLGRFARGEPIRARPVSATERGIKWARRRPAVSVLGLTVVALLATSFALVWSKYQAAERARTREEVQNQELVRTLAGERLARARALWRGNEVAAARTALDQVADEYRGEDWQALYHEVHAELVSLRIPIANAGRVVAAPDGKHLALFSVNDSAILLADARTGRSLGAIPLSAHPAGVAFTADGRLVVIPNVTPPMKQAYRMKFRREPTDEVLIWDLAKKAPMEGWKMPPTPRSVLSDDGTRVAILVGNEVAILDATTGAAVAEFPAEDESLRIVNLAIDRRGHRLATVFPSRIHLWDIATRQLLHTIPVSPGPHMGTFSPDGETFARATFAPEAKTAEADPVYDFVVWDIPGAREVFRTTAPVMRSPVTFSPAGGLFALEDMSVIHLCDARTGRRRCTLHGHTLLVGGMAFSPDGRRLYSVAANYVLKIWDVSPWTE
jgi:eukaryotic-like serine/threonine-protein kinase